MPGYRRRVIGLFILLLMFIRSMVLPLTYLEYHLRKDYIVDYLCENRFRPEMLCDGKCYLAKKLAQRQEQTTDTESIVYIKLLTTHLTCETQEMYSFPSCFFPELLTVYCYQSLLKPRDFPSGIFRPPAEV